MDLEHRKTPEDRGKKLETAGPERKRRRRRHRRRDDDNSEKPQILTGGEEFERNNGNRSAPSRSDTGEPHQILLGHTRPVVALQYSPETPNGYFLITASKDKTSKLWDGKTGNWIGTFEGHKGSVLDCCLDSKASIAATASMDHSVIIWDALKVSQKHCFEHKDIVRACAISQDSNRLLTGGSEKCLRLYDLNEPDAPPTEIETTGCIGAVNWLPHHTQIMCSYTDIGGISVWDLRKACKVDCRLDTVSPISSVEITPQLILAADGKYIKAWESRNFGLQREFHIPCTSASLDPQDQLSFVSAYKAQPWIHLCDFHSGAKIGGHRYKGHTGAVTCVRFAPDGQGFASTSEDGTVRLWKKGATAAADRFIDN